MTPTLMHLTAHAGDPALPEQFFPLLETDGITLEHIISHGKASAADFWYSQEGPEWVMLLAGTARLGFADGTLLAMQAGDYLLIPAHCQHRVEHTSLDARWLALHLPA